jgi:hypothetical protein
METMTAVRRSINATDILDHALRSYEPGTKGYKGSVTRIALASYALEVLEAEVAAEMTANARRCFEGLRLPKHSPKP